MLRVGSGRVNKWRVRFMLLDGVSRLPVPALISSVSVRVGRKLRVARVGPSRAVLARVRVGLGCPRPCCPC